jgi:hypothetical protein
MPKFADPAIFGSVWHRGEHHNPTAAYLFAFEVLVNGARLKKGLASHTHVADRHVGMKNKPYESAFNVTLTRTEWSALK